MSEPAVTATSGPTPRQQLEATCALLAEAVMEQVRYQRATDLIAHRVTLIDAERYRLFDLVAEDERAGTEWLMRPAEAMRDDGR